MAKFTTRTGTIGHEMTKQILILAGPNGAGKTTFAREFLTTEANCPTFLNADIIAAELSPQHPEQAAMRAARFMLQRIREEVAKRESFAFETTLANRSYAHWIREWQAAGYHVALWFLALPSAETALARVAQRVLQGGTTFRTTLFGVGLWLERPISRVFTRGWSTPGCCTTIPRPSRSC